MREIKKVGLPCFISQLSIFQSYITAMGLLADINQTDCELLEVQIVFINC